MSKKIFKFIDVEKAESLLSPPVIPPTGHLEQETLFNAQSFSLWLGQELLQEFCKDPSWLAAQPLLLGSWARGELTPGSDLDVLFVGDEKAVSKTMKSLQERGIKIRARTPLNSEDWEEGVQIYDVLALFKAKPLTQIGAQKLFIVQKNLWSRRKKLRKSFLKGLSDERKERFARYNSISNYLEPHLKMGPGGLRDIEQALQVLELFSEVEDFESLHAERVFKYYKSFWLTIRQKLHLSGFNDILHGSAQKEIGLWLGYDSQNSFMKEVQRGLSRVHFYSQWIFAKAAISSDQQMKWKKVHFKNMKDLILGLKKNPSVLMQQKVRSQIDSLCVEGVLKKNSKERGQWLGYFLDAKTSEAELISLFESRLIDKIIPEFQRLVGMVQHDQYHRYTTDVHILQICREFKKTFRSPQLLGCLAFIIQEMSPKDLQIMKWALFFHDIGKGLLGDHSTVGEKITEKELKKMGVLSQQDLLEVNWLVRNHLEVSKAAFKRNPNSQKTLDYLFELGVKGPRIRRLALLTALDIKATNPDAWNDWKARLISELVKNLESQKIRGHWEFQKLLVKKNISNRQTDTFDNYLIERLGVQLLVKDLQKIDKISEPYEILGYKVKNEFWIRIFEKSDRRGLFKKYVRIFSNIGVSIKYASVQTLSDGTVYDWFQFQTSKDLNFVVKLFKSLFIETEIQNSKKTSIKIDEVYWIQKDEDDWMIGFKGKDQVGFLQEVADRLYLAGLNVRSARIQTWGRQVDDIIQVQPEGNSDEMLLRLSQSSSF